MEDIIYQSPFSASGLPSGVTISYGSNPVIPGSTTNIILNNVSSVPQGVYYITINGTSGSLIRSRVIVLNILGGSGPLITSQPSNVSDCYGSIVSLNVVSPTALSYQWQVSNNGGFTFTNITSSGN